MPVYVDEVMDWGDWVEGEARQYGTKWCHMTADTEEELHAMARQIGLKRIWCSDYTHKSQTLLHYDLTPGKRWQAIKAGAIEIKVWGSKDRQEVQAEARLKAERGTDGEEEEAKGHSKGSGKKARTDPTQGTLFGGEE